MQQLIACDLCARTFFPDRIGRHRATCLGMQSHVSNKDSVDGVADGAVTALPTLPGSLSNNGNGRLTVSFEYREVQLDLTPEIEVFHMLFERSRTKNRKKSIKQHRKYFNFRSKVQLNHTAHIFLRKRESA